MAREPAGWRDGAVCSTSRSFVIDFREALLMDMSGCECKPDAKRKRDSAQPEAKGAAIKESVRCANIGKEASRR